jgi:hypothetical protein
MSAPANPAAFPANMIPEYQEGSPGMTLRDWFAGQALPAVCADNEVLEMSQQPGRRWTETVAGVSYDLADAMLAERAKVQS